MISGIYEGQKNQRVIDKFTPLVKKAFSSYVNELVNGKISSALSDTNDSSQDSHSEEIVSPQPVSKIITTEEELEAFYIIRAILAEVAPVEDIAHRDTESYFGILYKNNNRRPICRLNLDTKNKQLLIPDENKKFTRYYIDSLNDIYKYKTSLINVINRYI